MKRAIKSLFGIGVSAAVAFGVTNAASAVISFPYDPDGPGPLNTTLAGAPIPNLESLNWNVSSAVSVGFVPVVGSVFTTFYHASLSNFADTGSSNRNTFTVNGGLPIGEVGTNFEWTVVAKFKEIVTSINGGTATFAPVADPGNYMKVFFDSTVDSNNGAGTGFADGQLILEASDPANGLGTFTTTGQTGLFDQSANGDQFGGLQTVIGAGGFSVDVMITNFDPAFLDITLPPDGNIRISFLNSTLKNPFQEVDPSHEFFDMALNGGLGGQFTPNLGAVNGVSGPDFQFQADANQSFDFRQDIPEPATAALGLMGLAGLALRRRRTA